jgi:methionine-rich copper-binding protein CopC
VVKNVAATTGDKITLLQNPVTSTLSFTYTSTQNETIEVTVYNMAGIRLQSQKLQATNRPNVLTIPLDGKTAKGQYILSVQSTNGIKSATFIKQ